VRRFNEAFGPYGFPAKAIKPSYGLAEATLFVSTTPSAEEPTIISVDRDALNAGRFVVVPDDSPKAVAQAGAGKVGVAEWAVIVDAESATELPDGQIGEIWISGQNMGAATGASPRRAARRSRTPSSRGPHRRTPRAPTDDATWVRTGDYGAYHDGELFITGRVKDLVIVDGRNHYPQDLEYSAQEASKALRTGYVAAFSVPANQLPDEVFENAHAGLKRDPDDSSEQLVIVAERAGRAQARHRTDHRRHPRRHRGAPRRHGPRRAADRRRRHPAHLQRQDRPAGLPLGVPGRHAAVRQDGQRLPRPIGLTARQ
jgi:fatty acid CoA ligase FadD32